MMDPCSHSVLYQCQSDCCGSGVLSEPEPEPDWTGMGGSGDHPGVNSSILSAITNIRLTTLKITD